jgi:putative phosphoribosyl transferase
MTRFQDRRDAGRQLAERLAQTALNDPVVLGLPRGGILVAAEIAAALNAPLDVFVAQKVGAPGHEELGIGAVAEGSDDIVVTDTAARLGISDRQLHELAKRVRQEAERRVRTYRNDKKLPNLTGKDVVLVDDGLATGVTAEAALNAIRKHSPRRLVLAVPAGARESLTRLKTIADDTVCLLTPERFFAVGEWYDDFTQTTDGEVVEALATAARTFDASGGWTA